MNLIIDNTTLLVLLQSKNPITTVGGSYAIDGMKVGISPATAKVVTAEPITPFYPEVYIYSNGSYSIANQERYDACVNQDKSAYNASQKTKRSKAYAEEADPLFFKAQRGESTTAEWEAKVAEIKARFPYQQ